MALTARVTPGDVIAPSDRPNAHEQRASASAALVWLLPLVTALLVRVALGYRAVPSIDDFAYLPLAWAANDPTLYPRDFVLRHFVFHTPVWRAAVGGSEATIGLSAGFWVLTLLLTIATVAAACRLMRALGVRGLLLPLVAVLAFSGRIAGIGRGAYDGALGSAFHAQWLALCLLLWAYDAFVRERALSAGVLLGLATLSHPVVGAHGGLALVAGAAFASRGAWRRLLVTGATCAAVSAPVTVPLARALLSEADSHALPATEIIRQGYVFRSPNHYLLQDVPAPALLLLGVTALAGFAGALLLLRLRPAPAPRTLAGVLAGHVALGLAAFGLGSPWVPESWRFQSMIPYALDLTRTTPLMLVVAVVLAVSAAELRIQRGGSMRGASAWLWWSLVAGLGTLLVLARLHPAYLVLALLAGTAFVMERRGRDGRAAVLLGAAALGALAWSMARDVRQAPSSPAETELYRWAGTTPREALFVIPPGMQEFRLYARRSIYVDFKLFPASSPAAIPEWRRRMEQVAAPDRLALESPGWDGVVFWDRSYANRNTPRRIAELLQATAADYLVWDATGLEVPPFAPVPRSDDPRLLRVFRNQRFEVYRLVHPSAATPNG